MNQRFDLHNAPQIPQTAPLRAERRQPTVEVQPTSISGVTDTPSGLIRSTLIAAGAAGAILIFAYLPAEYGIDPTGVGGLLGLTEMGEIKTQLAAEDAADAAAAGLAPAAPAVPVAAADPALLDRLAAIEAQLAGIAAVIGAPASPEPAPAPAPVAPAPVAAPEPVAAEPAAPTPAAPAGWRDEVSYTLPPGEGVEIKLVMQEGAVATFEWTANGGALNYDTHGDDGAANNISYEQGRAVPEASGELTAAFTGNHGWFWRNRTEETVTLTLRTGGDYSELRAP